MKDDVFHIPGSNLNGFSVVSAFHKSGYSFFSVVPVARCLFIMLKKNDPSFIPGVLRSSETLEKAY
ncbi:MAG: hypothetical protein WC799_08290 [Desulfobacteraceae bacterium]|jgi:hypothetical protein